MGIKCEYCKKITDDESAVFCKYCGYRYVKSELDVLKNIEIILKENRRISTKDAKTQTRISYASLIISISAYAIALGALLVVALTQPVVEERYVGLGIVVIVLVFIWLIFKKYNVAPVDLDEIE